MIQTTSFGDPPNPTHQVLSYERQGEQIVERASIAVVVSGPLTSNEIAELLDGAMGRLALESVKFGGDGAALPCSSPPTLIECGVGCRSLTGYCLGHDVMEFAPYPGRAAGPNTLRDGLFAEVERLRNENASYRSVLASVGAEFEATADLVREMTELRNLKSAVRDLLANDSDADWLGLLHLAYEKA